MAKQKIISESALASFERLRRRITATLESAGVSLGDLLATLPAARNRVYAQRYGSKNPARAEFPKRN